MTVLHIALMLIMPLALFFTGRWMRSHDRPGASGPAFLRLTEKQFRLLAGKLATKFFNVGAVMLVYLEVVLLATIKAGWMSDIVSFAVFALVYVFSPFMILRARKRA